MNCSDIGSELMLYADGVLDDTRSAAVARHLEACPLCREKAGETRQLRSALSRMRRPEAPSDLKLHLRRAIREERRNQRTSWLPVSASTRDWLKLGVLPYAVGAVTSIVVGIGTAALMFSGTQNGHLPVAASGGSDSVLIAANRDPFHDRSRALMSEIISPNEFANSRLDVSRESPSINPQGGLVALTRSLVIGGMSNDEVVVVADVFGDGVAQVAEVVEPSHDRSAVARLEKALASNDPRDAAFVSANLDNRSDSVRVVLKFQSVNVPTRIPTPRR